MAARAAEVVGIVGAGTMGAGIAQVALEAGHRVVLWDALPEAFDAATDRILVGLTKRATKAGHDAAWIADRLVGLGSRPTLEAAARDADILIEAAIEDLEAKRAIFRSLAATAAPNAILATNTSALSVAAIAAATDHADRVIGLHFFNPAPVMRLVEVVSTPASDPAVIDRAVELMTAWGKTPVRCTDSPGFIVNRVNRPFTIEALRILESGMADLEPIDAAMRRAGFPMGPFELMDLIGVDVNLAAARGVWDGLGRPSRLRPSSIQERLVTAGHFGRKTGQGFYRYDEAGHPTGHGASLRSAARAAASADPEVIATRIRTAIDAEAALAVAQGVASADDIELALRLGAGHPGRTLR